MSGPSFRYMLIFVGSEKRAVLAPSVQEILESAKVYEIPFAPKIVLGMINIRGEAYSLIDVFSALEEKEIPNPGNEFLVFKYDGDRFCMRMTRAETFFESEEFLEDGGKKCVEYLGEKIPVLDADSIEAAIKKELEMLNG